MPMEKPAAIWSGGALRCDSLCQNLAESLFQGISGHGSERAAGLRHITGDLTVMQANQPPRPLHDLRIMGGSKRKSCRERD